MSKGEVTFIVKTDDTLEQELRINVVFYEYAGAIHTVDEERTLECDLFHKYYRHLWD